MSRITRHRKNRVATITTIIHSLACPNEGVIAAEFDEVLAAVKTPNARRRYLLQVLHSTRALDTTLVDFTTLRGRPPAPPTLGGCLHALRLLGLVTNQERQYYQQMIVDIRNHFMHRAGAFPTDDNEVNNLLSEMEACLATIAAQ